MANERTKSWTYHLLSVAAFIPVLVFVCWSAMDASFPLAVWASKANLGLEKWFEVADPTADQLFGVTDKMVKSLRQWDHLGKRMVFVYLLAAAGLLSGLACVRRACRDRWSLVICVLLGCSWCGFFATRQKIEDWRTTRQARDLLVVIEPLVETLQTDWPTEARDVRGLGRCLTRPGDDQLYVEDAVRGDGYPLSLKVGISIERDDAVLRFGLIPAYEQMIEFHPEGFASTRLNSRFDHWQIKIESTIRLKEKWYLVRYSQSLDPTN